METLHLDPGRHWCPPSPEHRITLQGLDPLSIHCPLLESFGATIDATAPPPPPAPSTTSLPHSSLSWLTGLHVGDAEVDSPPAVAAYLSRILPELGSVVSFHAWDAAIEEDPESEEHARGDGKTTLEGGDCSGFAEHRKITLSEMVDT